LAGSWTAGAITGSLDVTKDGLTGALDWLIGNDEAAEVSVSE